MNGRFMAMMLFALLAVQAPAFGYSAEVRERMMVRNLAPPRLSDSIRPVLARDVAPGAGIFDYSSGPTGYGWPVLAAGPDSLPYNIAILDSGGYLLSRSRVSGWPLWDSVFGVADSGNQPMYETHNIASSPVSNKVCITWVRTDTSPMPGYYRISSDGGANWDSVKQLDWPPAYGGDTVTSFHLSSFYPFYDEDDKLNVLAAVHPIVNDTGYIMPAGIWHWCPVNSPNWRLLRRAGCAPEHLGAQVGYNALYACRPSGCCIGGHLILVTWEQFDSANVDPQTNLLRAAIHVCAFEDGGAYLETLRMTEPGPYSYRFPVVATYPSDFDSSFVVYEVDQIAGFAPIGQGPCTNNPILCQQLYFPMHIYLGELDTIGGTTCDLQFCGAAHRAVHEAPGCGVHAVWMWSDDTTGTFPDLNMRYNFYDCWNHLWNWTDFDFMQSGVNVFPYRTGLGCMDVDTSGVAVISATAPPPLPPVSVEESRKPQAPSRRLAATVVRSLPPGTVAFDAMGRRATNPQFGVFFVREEPRAISSRSQATYKVVIAR